MKERTGFTLLELLITLAILATITALVTLNLSGDRRKTDLTDATQEIGALLRQAQSDSMAQEKGVGWGVYFSNVTATPAFYALFASTTYSTSVIVGEYPLPSTISYITSTLAQGATTSITFSSVTGGASASTSIGLYANGQTALSSTISIASSGTVSY